MHRLAGRTRHTTGRTLSTTTITRNTNTKTAHTTITTHNITTTQLMESMTIKATARDMLQPTQAVWSTTLITTATARAMYQTPMAVKKPRQTHANTDSTMSTHQEIADELGVSRAAISDIEKKALRKLKAILKERGLKPEDLFGEEWNR